MKKILLSSVAFSLSAIVAPFTIVLSANAADAAKGGTLYAQRCAMCHGDKGAGDGALAATMPEGQKPRNLGAGANKYATDDAKLKEIIKNGGASVGLSVLMPAQSDLSDEQLNDLVAFVNSLKK
jgi:mono/diheme cytochrome c family protein